jgi:hypothetical protein
VDQSKDKKHFDAPTLDVAEFNKLVQNGSSPSGRRFVEPKFNITSDPGQTRSLWDDVVGFGKMLLRVWLTPKPPSGSTVTETEEDPLGVPQDQEPPPPTAG